MGSSERRSHLGARPRPRTTATGRPARDGAPTSGRAAVLGLATSLVLLLAGLAVGGRTLTLWREHGTAPVPPGTGVEVIALGLTALVAGWLALLLGAGALSVLPGRACAVLRSAALVLSPRVVPRVATLLLAVTATTASSFAAQAAPGGTVAVATSDVATPPGQTASPPLAMTTTASSSSSEPEPGWAPTAPSPAPSPDSIDLVSRGSAPPEEVVVVAGDTLWAIAARHLGARATVEQVAAEWPRWYAVNQEAIGPDPDLILPGTRLVPPVESGQSEGPDASWRVQP